MFLFLCSFSIAFCGCLDLFYFHLRFIKNFQIIWEEFPFFSQFFTMHLNCGVLALFTFLSLCPRLLPWARSVRACYSFTLPLGCCRGLALCVLVICVCFARSPPGLLGFARSGLAQHHIECHHEAEAHHKCYGGAV